MNRSATRTVAAPSSDLPNGTARAVICANPGLKPVTSLPPRSRMPWAARESDGTTTTNTSELLSVGKEQLSGATATPSTGSQDSRTEMRIDGPMGRASYQPTAQRVPTLGAASQPTPSLQLQVLVHHRPRRSLGGH